MIFLFTYQECTIMLVNWVEGTWLLYTFAESCELNEATVNGINLTTAM